MSDHITAPHERLYHAEEEHHPENGTYLGFWIYLMSDALIFAVLFATHAVLSQNFAGGKPPAELFSLPLVAVNTAILLTSSLTFGYAMLAAQEENVKSAIRFLAITGLLGACFLSIELYEFAELIAEGAGPTRSGYLSSFFALVGTHGLHVSFGIIWIAVLIAQIRRNGLQEANMRRLSCLSLFWHFLDIIWIGVFTFVYLLGVAA